MGNLLPMLEALADAVISTGIATEKMKKLKRHSICQAVQKKIVGSQRNHIASEKAFGLIQIARIGQNAWGSYLKAVYA